MIDLVELSGRSKSKLIQFALDLGKVKQGKLRWPMLLSEKYDGCYCLALKYQGVVTIYSRTGEVYVSMKHIETELSKIMLDGDMIIFEAYTEDTVQSKISGWCRDTKTQHRELCAYCHTLLSLDEFIHGGTVPYVSNNNILRKLILDNDYLDCSVVHYILQLPVDSMELALLTAQRVWDRGGEGCVLRDPSAVFQGGKRNQSIIKLKQGLSFDLEVIGVYEGTGKYQGILGGLQCRWKDNGIINISGMLDSQRRLWWDNPSLIISKIVQVDAMCISSKGLLRECRFKGIRMDKTEGDY